jgi:hypothetical protein
MTFRYLPSTKQPKKFWCCCGSANRPHLFPRLFIRTRAPPPFSAINSTPAFSRALRRSAIVRACAARRFKAIPREGRAHHKRSQTAADRQKRQDADAIGELAKAVLDRYHDRGEDQAADDGFQWRAPRIVWTGNVGAMAPGVQSLWESRSDV